MTYPYRSADGPSKDNGESCDESCNISEGSKIEHNLDVDDNDEDEENEEDEEDEDDEDDEDDNDEDDLDTRSVDTDESLGSLKF